MTPAQARGKAGLTQRQLAKKARISRNTVQRAERDNVWPRSEIVFFLYCRALGIEPIR